LRPQGADFTQLYPRDALSDRIAPRDGDRRSALLARLAHLKGWWRIRSAESFVPARLFGN
jgi:hypothetical protein